MQELVYLLLGKIAFLPDPSSHNRPQTLRILLHIQPNLTITRTHLLPRTRFHPPHTHNMRTGRELLHPSIEPTCFLLPHDGVRIVVHFQQAGACFGGVDGGHGAQVGVLETDGELGGWLGVAHFEINCRL